MTESEAINKAFDLLDWIEKDTTKATDMVSILTFTNAFASLRLMGNLKNPEGEKAYQNAAFECLDKIGKISNDALKVCVKTKAFKAYKEVIDKTMEQNNGA